MTDPATPPEQPPSDPTASTVENAPAEKPWTPEAWTPEPWTPEAPAPETPETPQPAAADTPAPEPQAPPALEPPNPYGPPPQLPQAPMYNPGYQPQPYGSPYPPPAYGYGYMTPSAQELRQQRTGLAIGALVCSLVGIFTCGLGSIAGVVMGHVSYSQAKRGEAGGQGLALSAVIIGYVVLALWAGFIVASFLTGLFQGINDH
jgi:hypothetical protein